MMSIFKQNQRTAAVLFFLVLLPVLTFVFPARSCNAAPSPGSEFKMQIQNRIEVIASSEGLSPSDTYGRWNSLHMNYFRQAREDTILYAQLTGHTRKEGNGFQTTVGIVKDWSKSFYTNTAIGTGTNAVYLPKVSIDHDFNFKFGKEKQYVWSVGGTYIQYYDDHKDFIMKTGLTAYLKKWVLEYHLFRNMSNPGSVESFSHSFSAAYGLPKRSWTTLTYSFGHQAYLASALAMPEAVRNYSQFVSLSHRRWLGPHHGIIGEVSYLNLVNAYDKLGVSFGFFREY